MAAEPHSPEQFPPEQDQANLELLPQAVPTYIDIVSAEDPAQAYQAIAEDAQVVGELLHVAEHDVATTAAQLKMRVHTKGERERFTSTLESYETLLGLILKDKTQEMKQAGASDPEIKRSVAETIVKSKKSILEDEINLRLEGSLIERMKKSLGASKVRRLTGKMALAAAGAGSAYAFAKFAIPAVGLQDDAEHLVDKATPELIVGYMIGVPLIKNVIGFGKDKVNKQIEDYTPAGSLSPTKDQTDVTYEEHWLHVHQEHLSDLRGDLYAVLGSEACDQGIQEPHLIDSLMQTLDESFDKFYGIKEEKKKDKTDDVEVEDGIRVYL